MPSACFISAGAFGGIHFMVEMTYMVQVRDNSSAVEHFEPGIFTSIGGERGYPTGLLFTGSISSLPTLPTDLSGSLVL